MLLDSPIITERLFFPRQHALDDAFTVQCDGAELACYRAPGKPPADRTFIHFHGNGEVVADYVPDYAQAIAELGVDVVLAEYRGYGGSTGTPGAVAMLDDVDAIFAAVGRPARDVVVYGRSIGSIYAIELARRHPDISGLILESGIADVLERMMIRVTPKELGVSREEFVGLVAEHFDHRQKLASYAGPLLIIHAEDDHVVDVSHARRNHEWAAGERKELALFERGGHNALMSANWPNYVALLQRFLAATAG